MRRIIPLLLTLSVISCNSDSNSYRVEGNATGFDDGTQVFVYTILDNNQPKVIDTLTIEKGKFMGTYTKTDDISVNYLRVDKLKNTLLYFPENVDLKATLFKDSIQSSFVSGSAQNDNYKEYSEQIRSYNNQKIENVKRFRKARKEQDNLLVSEIQKENIALINEESNFKKQFVTNSSNSLISVTLLSEMVSRKEISTVEAITIIDNLSPKVAAKGSTKNLIVLINSMKKADVGEKAPEFSAPNPDGKIIALYDVLGKYTIIDFWASWCKPCRRENPNVVKVYNKYHNKGLNIISVSLDKQGQKERWIKAIKDDNLTWKHVSNLKFWSEPVAQQYNVRSIPATFLLDENGIIIAKNLRGNALDVKIASLLGD